MKPYYYVLCVGGEFPLSKHSNLELAHAEAMRLAQQYPSISFEILQCVGLARASGPQTFWMDGVTPHCNINR
jgi:hypothetical protein